ncbi:MAG: hypothetical protein Q9217_006962, partial [Psora testacea]
DLTPLLHTLQQIDLIHQLIQSHPNDLALATSSAEIWSAFRSGKIASLIGVEGLHQVVESASVLRMYWRLGVRYITLSHNSNNPYVDAACAGDILAFVMITNPLQKTELKPKTTNTSTSLCPHPRNVTDDILDLLKLNGGIIMICFLPNLTRTMTTATQSESTVSTVATHILHAGQRIGFSHVGIGSDFDGMLDGPEGIDDVGMYPALVAELLAYGVGEEEAKGVCGGNLMRVLDAVKMRAGAMDGMATMGVPTEGEGTEGKMLCDVVEGVWDRGTRELLVKTGEERRRRAGALPADGVDERV